MHFSFRFTETVHGEGDIYTLTTILKTNSFETSDAGSYTCRDNKQTLSQEIKLFAVKGMPCMFSPFGFMCFKVHLFFWPKHKKRSVASIDLAAKRDL